MGNWLNWKCATEEEKKANIGEKCGAIAAIPFSFVRILLPVTSISYKTLVIAGSWYHSFGVHHQSNILLLQITKNTISPKTSFRLIKKIRFFCIKTVWTSGKLATPTKMDNLFKLCGFIAICAFVISSCSAVPKYETAGKRWISVFCLFLSISPTGFYRHRIETVTQKSKNRWLSA